MLSLVTADWKAQDGLTQEAPPSSVGRRLVQQAQEAFLRGDEIVATLMLELAYEAYDSEGRRGNSLEA